MTDERDGDWSLATWEGSRRALLRQSLKLTVRQRLEALDQLSKTNDRMQALRAQGKFYYESVDREHEKQERRKKRRAISGWLTEK